MKIIVAASNNENKILEIKQILSKYKVISLKEAGIKTDPIENGLNFEENALIKAREASKCTNYPVIADDSGLEVDCLNGQPGIHSKRYYSENLTDEENNIFLLKNLKKFKHEERSARFKCCIAYISENKEEHIFTGQCEGVIITEPKGENGFGYDPYFYIDKYKKTTAEMTDFEKNRISHRGIALKKLKLFLKEQIK